MFEARLVACRVCIEKGVAAAMCTPTLAADTSERIGKYFITCPHCRTCCSVGEDPGEAIDNWGINISQAQRWWRRADAMTLTAFAVVVSYTGWKLLI